MRLRHEVRSIARDDRLRQIDLAIVVEGELLDRDCALRCAVAFPHDCGVVPVEKAGLSKRHKQCTGPGSGADLQ